MGKHDNRRSLKMRRRKGQAKLKARIKRRKDLRRAQKDSTGTSRPAAAKKTKTA